MTVRPPVRARATRVVPAVVLTLVGVLVAAGLAPLALREQSTDGLAADTAAALTGPAQAASDGLRGLGFSCSDTDVAAGVVTRVCTRVRFIELARVELVVAAEGGAVQRASTSVDEGASAQATHRAVLEVLADAVGLGPADRDRVLGAVAGDTNQLVELGWGTFGVRSGPPRESDLRATARKPPAPSPVPAGPSAATLAGSVDALAATARSRGYVCSTPQIQTVRGCVRTEGGYRYDLWMEGTDRVVATLDLSVTATYRTRTRSRWVEEMGVVLTGMDTDQGRRLADWVARSAEAPGAEGYVDGLPIWFLVRADEYTKETFGGVKAECAPYVGNLSACAP